MNSANADRVTLTPNRRLARALRDRFAQRQRAAGHEVWETPRILPWETFLRELWEQGRAQRCVRGEPPRLLSGLAAATLWEQLIEGSGELETLLPAARVVPEVMAAWGELHAHAGDRQALLRRPPTPAVASFARWAESYAQRCRHARWLDPAELPAALLADAEALTDALPRELELVGFDRRTPQQERLLGAFARAGCTLHEAGVPEPKQAPRVYAYADAQAELRAAAAWAAQQVRASDQTCIALVFPDLAARRAEIQRAFTAALAPARLLRPWDEAAPAFEVSLGEALAEHPLIAPALGLLGLAEREAPLGDVITVLRSPFLAGDAENSLALAALERSLLDDAVTSLTPTALRQACLRHEKLASSAALLSRWRTLLDEAPRRQTASAWRRQWEAELALWDWPAGRPLSSVNYQAREAWGELLDEWLGVEGVMGQVTRGVALESLRRAAGERPFQPEGGGARVLLLGALEAAGLDCDALWVSGLTARFWPREARPNPYLPLAWQKVAGLPEALPEAAMAQAQTLLRGYLARAKALVFSRPRCEGEEVLVPSPLLSFFGVAEETAAAPETDGVIEAVAMASRSESLPEDAGLPLMSGGHAGAYALTAQAACPFQAYGRFRLTAESWPEPQIGLSAVDRGKLVHWALEHLWSALHDLATLAALDAGEHRRRIALAAEFALGKLGDRRWARLPQFVRVAEQERLVRLLAAELQVEAQRPPFALLAPEGEARYELAGLSLHLRPDRIDQLADGRCLVIDYKTGRAPKPAEWTEDPPRDAQLPLYALAQAGKGVAGILVLRLADGACNPAGLVADASIWPDLKGIAEAGQRPPLADWPALLEFWRTSLSGLAADYLAGRAEIKPREPEVCRYCPLPALCRIGEITAITEAEASEGEADA